MAWLNLRQWFSSQTPFPRSEKPTGAESEELTREEKEKLSGHDDSSSEEQRKSFYKNKVILAIVTLLFLVYTACLVFLVIKDFHPAAAPVNCSDILLPLTDQEIRDTIFAGKWTLQEAYSTDSIDRYALTHAKSSWAQFIPEENGTIYLHMSHLLYRPENNTIWCVYHHFPNMTIRNNTLYLTLPQYNSSAKIQFLKACNECLVLTAEAYVPGYEALNYLLAYGLHPTIDEYYIRHTRRQARCMRLAPPAPFKYENGYFCPDDDDHSAPTKTNLKDILKALELDPE